VLEHDQASEQRQRQLGRGSHRAPSGNQIAARKRRGRKGGRPPGLDVEACKGRNLVERSFALAKQWRALGTRYDKLAITHRAAVVLSACMDPQRGEPTTSTSFPRT
jgi:transposase